MVSGYIHPDFGGVAPLLDRCTGGPKRFGGAFAVYHRGEKVVDIWSGPRNAHGDPWQEDTMAMSFSTTKGVASTAVHMCADRGLVDYDAPVADYWPEFAAAGKVAVTVRHLLTHSAGLHRLRGLVDSADQLIDWDAMTTILAEQPSDPPAGAGPGYHGITYGWLVGEVVRRVTGMPLREFVQTEIARPLGLDGCHIGVPDQQLGRVAPLLPDGNDADIERMRKLGPRLERIRFTRRLAESLLVDEFGELVGNRFDDAVKAVIPAAAGVFTARSLARLYAAIANGGELDGVRIMSQERVHIMGERQAQVDQRDYCIGLNMGWRLGFHEAFLVSRSANRGFGHFGYGGSGAWADPDADLAAAFVTNDLSRATTPFADFRILRLGVAARRAAARR